MIEVTFKGDDYAAILAAMREIVSTEPTVEKTLADFPLQEIMDYVLSKGISVTPVAGEAETQKPKAKKVKAAEPALEVTGTTTVGEKLTISSPTEDKATAIKEIMSIFTDPKGKAVANTLLKAFGVKNFHLIDDARGSELLAMVAAERLKVGI